MWSNYMLEPVTSRDVVVALFPETKLKHRLATIIIENKQNFVFFLFFCLRHLFESKRPARSEILNIIKKQFITQQSRTRRGRSPGDDEREISAVPSGIPRNAIHGSNEHVTRRAAAPPFILRAVN